MTFSKWTEEHPRIRDALVVLLGACDTEARLQRAIKELKHSLYLRRRDRANNRLKEARKNLGPQELNALVLAVDAIERGAKGQEACVPVEFRGTLNQAGLVVLGGYPTLLGIRLVWLLEVMERD